MKLQVKENPEAQTRERLDRPRAFCCEELAADLNQACGAT